MISLDTNELLGKAPGRPLLRMLHKVAQVTGHDLVLPEMAAEEYLAHYSHDVQIAAKQVRDALDYLHRLFPSWSVQTPPPASLEEIAEKERRSQLEQIIQIYPTPSGVWQEALRREARRYPPAKTSWDTSGSGARDVAIWLTILDACHERKVETYFVSRNSSDFGKDGSLRPELRQDLTKVLGDDAHLFHYCSDIPSLMTELGIEKVQPPEDSSIACAVPVQLALRETLSESDADFEVVQGIPNLALKLVASREEYTIFSLSGSKIRWKLTGSGKVYGRAHRASGLDLRIFRLHGYVSLCHWLRLGVLV